MSGSSGNLNDRLNQSVNLPNASLGELLEGVKLNYFAAIIESSDDAIISKSLDGIVTSWNPAAERMFRYKAQEIIGKPITLLFPPDRIDEEAVILEKMRKGEKVDHFETIRVRKDGGQVIVSATISPVINDEGRIVGVSKILRDIGESKRAEERMAEQADLLDRTRDAIFVRDIEGKVLFWSKGATRIYGWTAEEVIGRNVLNFMYSDSRKYREVFSHLMEHGEWAGELEQLSKDQKPLTMDCRWSLILDKNGAPKSVLAVNSDVTEKKKVEAQFMRAQRMESIGTLASGIAHDLNNILAPILLSMGLLKAAIRDPELLDILDTVETAARRGSDVVQQVLSFGRGLSGGRLEVQPSHLLRDVEQIIKDSFPKSIGFQSSIPADAWSVNADPTQIHQLLLNLCVNARDAMPHGGTLTLACENRLLDEQYAAMNIESKVGPYLVLSVTDNGTGIAPAVLDKMFEPFFTTKEIGKGSGLGLSTVLAIVKGHQGFVKVYSELGRGTTFKVYLPAQLDTDRVQEISMAVMLPRGNNELVLVVDDEASILTITSQTLQAFGYRVLTARDGAEAVALYARRSSEISVVITDIMMPIMDGIATINVIQRLNIKAKIIAASGLNANGSMAKATAVGIRHFLPKPYTAEALLQTLRLIIEEDVPSLDKT